MRNKSIPFYWRVSELTLVAFHRYTSHATDCFIEVRRDDEEEAAMKSREWFNELRKRVESSWILFDDGVKRTRQWDNKVVIECKTTQGNTIFVGYYDLTMCIGLSVRSDSWIKPCPFVQPD